MDMRIWSHVTLEVGSSKYYSIKTIADRRSESLSLPRSVNKRRIAGQFLSLSLLVVAIAGLLAPPALAQETPPNAVNQQALRLAQAQGAPSVPVADPTGSGATSPESSVDKNSGRPSLPPVLLPDLARADPQAAARLRAATPQAEGTAAAVGTQRQAQTPQAGAAGTDASQAHSADANAALATTSASTSTTGDDDLKAIASESGLAVKGEPASFNGSFTHSIALGVPAYHGLEPKLSLRYDSNGGARAGGYWAGLAGIGFQIGGLSDIVRASAVDGARAYTATDEFMLDGDRLVACAAGMTSPACTTGAAATGVTYYATRVESFVLAHSRHIAARFVLHQDLQTLLRCHMAAFEAIGGVPVEILYDRMKTAVTGEDDEGHIIYNRSLLALARHGIRSRVNIRAR